MTTQKKKRMYPEDACNIVAASPQQQGVWFHAAGKGISFWNFTQKKAYRGPLNADALKSALEAVLKRHSSLRTSFRIYNDQLCQLIWDNIPVEDLWEHEKFDNDDPVFIERTLSAASRREELYEFDIENECQVRFKVLEFANESYFILTMNHIITDMFSMQLCWTELARYYNEYLSGQAPVLTLPGKQYFEYAISQNNTAAEAAYAQQKQYWLNKFSGQRPVLDLSFYKSAPSICYRETDLPASLTAEIRVLSLRKKVLHSAVYQLAYFILLHKYSKHNRISIGNIVNGRGFGKRQYTDVIGLFAKRLVNTLDLQEDDTVSSLLERVNKDLLDSFAHSDVPYEEIVREINRKERTGLAPLFQAVFNMIRENGASLSFEGLTECPVPGSGNDLVGDDQYDVGITLTDNGQRVRVRLDLKCDAQFEPLNAFLLRNYVEILEACVRDMTQRVADIGITEEERSLLDEFSGAEVNYPRNKTMVDLLEAQALRTPEGIAVVCGAEQINYKTLRERSNQLAHYLRASGVTEDSLVCICMNRSIDMIVGMIGILKAGGAYVPIDPEYPQERISYLLNDTAAGIVISETNLKEIIPADYTGQVLLLDELSAELEQQPLTAPVTSLQPHHLAYIIYTSGSTGKPKGVMVEHRNVVRLFETEQPLYDFTAQDVWTLFHSFSFDFSVWEMYGALLYGGRLVIVPRDVCRDTELFAALLIREGVTVLNQTPSAFYVLQDHLTSRPAALLLRYVIFGGESLELSRVERWQRYYPSCRLINMYGITETTVHVTYQEIGAAEVLRGGSLIGRPIPTLQCYILDGQQCLQPVGVAGEIYVGGAGVARGYWHRPELTAARFLPDPFGKETGGRLYRSGDLGRWLADGRLEYLGRADGQVKIRGYRIELGEIESVTEQSGLVRQCVVAAQEDGGGNKRLVGYVVANESFDRGQLQQYLQARLPAHMIPAIWIELEALPLTSNGKVDKSALPAAGVDSLQEKAYEAPRNELEQRMAQIWQQLLGVERVGIHDNFFSLGGDSIIIIQVASRCKQANISVRPKDIFLNPSIARLSAAISAHTAAAALRAEQGTLQGECGLLPIQQWFLDKRTTKRAGCSHYNQALLLSISKAATPAELSAVVEILVERHDALRFHYTLQAAGWQQQYGSHSTGITVCDLRREDGAALADAIGYRAAAYQQSLDIEKGYLLRAVLFETPVEEPENRLLLVIHHLAVDGVSWRILAEDLEALTDDLKAGRLPAPVRKSSSVRDWCHALHEYGRGERLLAQQAYWEALVKNRTLLPVDKKWEGASQLKDWETIVEKLPLSSTRRLLQEVPAVYHTEINDILLAALAGTLSEWVAQKHVLIGLEGHGREEDLAEGIDLSRTVGWFTSLYPVLLDVSSGLSIDERIKIIKENIRKIPDKGLGYGVLKYLNKNEALAGEDPWEIVFNYLGQVQNVLKAGAWTGTATEPAGAVMSGELDMPGKLSVNSWIAEDQLQLHWSYNSRWYNSDTIQQIARSYTAFLEAVITHCLGLGREVFTPSDYGLGQEISYRELDNFLAQEGKAFPGNDIVSIAPLSGLQEGMLFHSLYEDGIKAYIEQWTGELTDVKPDVLAESWSYLLQRHSILRSGFYSSDFQVPVQCVFRQVFMNVEELDLRSLDKAEQQQELGRYAASAIEKGFDLRRPPLMRIAVIRLEEHLYQLVWTWHHILFDGWSMAVLLDELKQAYKRLSSGQELPLTAEDRYEKYISYIQRVNRQAEKSWWQQYLNGVERPVLLPFIGRAAERTKGIGTYAQENLQLGEAFTRRLMQYAQQQQVTLNTIMQGVWAYLLYRYTGEDEVVYGVTVSGRPEDLAGVERRVGMYINTLPLHTHINPAAGIGAWLREIQHGQVSGRQYQYSRLSDIRQWAKVPDDLFDSLLVYENYPAGNPAVWEEGGLNIRNASLREQTNYPLTLTIAAEQEITISFSYNTAMLDAAVLRRIRENFRVVLTRIVENGTDLINTLDLLTEEEQHTLLQISCGPVMELPHNKTVVDLLEEQAARTPNALAVVYGDRQLTYQQLSVRSNRLAHYLQSCGAQADSLIGICMERSPEMIIGIAAILKSGAAYVPIDPAYPEERINYLLADTEAAVVLSHTDSRHVLPAAYKGRVILMDAIAEELSGEPAGLPLTGLQPHHLAYVIYTSGSTGRPKGVMIEHGSLLNYLLYSREHYLDKESASGTYVYLSTTFDASLTALLTPLIAGRPMVISRAKAPEIFEDPSLDAGAPYDFIKLTPAHLPLLIHRLQQQHITGAYTKRLVLGGEALHPGDLRYFADNGINIEIINEYGPTEATVGCSTYQFSTAVEIEQILIGRPLTNVRLYILNKEAKLSPVGVVGELYIGGAGVARGYWRRPELTAERFIPDRFSTLPGARLYRTGDLCRWLPDGNIAYLGRLDDQVKINGYRIEPGEIEQLVQQSGQVRQCVVMAREDGSGNKRLVGYVVCDGAFDREKLLAFLSQYLPDYMIPQLWVCLPELPLTQTGKIDKRSLPDVDLDTMGVADYEAPRSSQEALLAELWQELLGVDRVGLRDNFFALGGHSLLAMRLAAAIRKQLGITLSLRDIFTHATLGALSDHMRAASRTSEAALSLQARPEHLPLSFDQERLWVIDQLEGSVHYHIPYVVRLQGELNVAALEHSLKTIIDRHEVLRTVIYEHEGIGYQRVTAPGCWQMQQYNNVYEYMELKKDLVEAPFDLRRDGMFRAQLIRIAAGEHILVMTVHHMAADGWSWNILCRELSHCYRCYVSGRAVQLPLLPLQYADYALWERSQMQGAQLTTELSYWQQQLKGLAPLELPTDYARPLQQETAGAGCHLELGEDIAAGLRMLSRDNGCSLFMTLLTAFKVLLYRYSGQEDICVGSPVSGRHQQETEGLIGFFVNTLALRTDLSGNPAFRELLLRVRETTLSGYDHQGVPFSKIVETVMQDRDMSRSPVFQVMFAMQQEGGPMELEGLSVLPEPAGSERVKFELTLTVTDRGNGLVCYLSYSRSLYEEATMRRMLGHYEQLLSSIVSDPETPIGDLQILDEQETQLLLDEFSGAEADYPRNKTIADLLEAQALRTPEGIAVVCGTEQINYKTLRERSNQLAHYLRTCGVVEDSLVCICMNRSIEMIVGMIGILKAGGAYVPIDPEYPRERISYLLNDTAASIVISETGLKEIIPADYTGQVLLLDALSAELEQQPMTAPVTSLQPHHLAYVIYTSGSTGKPKGVMVEHRNVLNLLNGFQLLAPPEKAGAGLTLCPFIFDVSVWELFINLCFGNTLHVLGQEHALDPTFIAQYLIKQQITTAYFPPTILAAVADVFEASGKDIFLKRLLVGVLPIRQAVLQRFCNRAPDLRIINGYGPTETTVCGTFFHFRKAYAPEQNVPIGKPVANNKVYILDAGKHLVPLGVAGEICIAGEGVGRGYWNNEALSNQQFIQDPFSADNNARLYCTGDKGKWLPGGNIMYLGRLDDQLKIRGYRIEPGEIESAAQQSGLVDQCMVLTREAPGEEKALVAFVTPGENFNRKEMVRYLQNRLPAYMIPGLWVALPEFPLTPNGKIDKRALLATSANDLLTGANTAPRNETEEVLAEIWKELLHTGAVSVYDNFFALGGHSLLGMQLMAALKKRFRLEVPLKMIFRLPCIADLAEYIQLMQPSTDKEPENIPYKIFEL